MKTILALLLLLVVVSIGVSQRSPASSRTGRTSGSQSSGRTAAASRGSILAASGGGGTIAGLLDDALPHAPADYLTFTPPAKGSTYTETVFGTTILRATDGFTDISDGISGEYGTHPAFNADSTRMLGVVAIGGGYRVINTTTGAITNNPGISGSAEATWDHQDSNVFYYHTGNQIKSYNISTSTSATVATFNGTGGLPSYTTITFGGEKDISEDNDYITVIGDSRFIGLYKFSTSEFTASPLDINAASDSIDWVDVSPNNNVVIRFTTGGNQRISLYTKAMSFVRQLVGFGGHADRGRDPSTGDELLFLDLSNDSSLPSGCTNSGIGKIKLSDATKTCFFGFPDFNLTGHISCNNIKGHPWVMMAEYDGRSNTTTGTAIPGGLLRSDWADASIWKKYYNQVFIKNMVTGEVRLLAYLRSRITNPNGYWFSPRGSLNIDATKATFASNMNTYHHRNLTGTLTVGSGTPSTVTGSGTAFLTQVVVGGEITVNSQTRIVSAVASNTSLTVSSAFTSFGSGVSGTAHHPDYVDAYIIAIQTPNSDVTAPTISSVTAGSITTSGATIAWTTDEAATSQVEWGTTTFYSGGISAFDTTLVTSHSVAISGLASGTTYHYRVKSRDAAGNYKFSADATFVTN